MAVKPVAALKGELWQWNIVYYALFQNYLEIIRNPKSPHIYEENLYSCLELKAFAYINFFLHQIAEDEIVV